MKKDKAILVQSLAKLRGREKETIADFSTRIETEINKLTRLEIQRDSLKVTFNEQKIKIRVLSREVQSLFDAGESQKVNEKLKELIKLINEITHRIHDKSFDDTFE